LNAQLDSINPRLALDMYVLGQGVRTGVYRVCDELFPRLIKSPHFSSSYLLRKGFEEGSIYYIGQKGLPDELKVLSSEFEGAPQVDILLSPFGVAPPAWRSTSNIVHAHIIYDLIAIHHPEFFTPEGAEEVKSIVSSLDRNSVIFAISKFTKQDLLNCRKDLEPDQVTVIPLAAGNKFKFCGDVAERSRVRSKYGIPPGVPYVLSLATLEIRKNLEQVICSFVLYLDRHPASGLRLVLSGMTGWKLEKLEAALVSAGPWRDRIVFTGYVDDDDLSALYSDALCFLYLSRYEGFGLPPLEAMSCGTPVITSNNSSLPEVIGDAGFMFDADDIESVAAAIANMVSSTELRDRYSALALQRAQLFSWDRCAEIVEEKMRFAVERRMSGEANEEFEKLSDLRSPVQASFLGYESGNDGPSFRRQDWVPPTLPDGSTWPVWVDMLGPNDAGMRIEGGLRTSGVLKSGTESKPLITFVTVVRNNEKTLARTIHSVQQQSYDNVEHIILDGASTDGTLDIIRGFADRIDYFASEPDRGLYDAINKAIPLARGDLICVLNSDDWLQPDSAAIAAKLLGHGKYNGLLLTAANVVQDGTLVHYWKPAFVHPGTYFICADVCHNGIYATRKAYENSGPYDSTYKVAADFKWVMQCLDSGSIFRYTPEVAVNYSLGGTSSNVAQHAQDCLRVVRERFSFLETKELNGLYHCFHAFASLRGIADIDVPESYTEFVKRLFAKYAAKPDFLQALAWAGMINMEHRLEKREGSNVAPPSTSPPQSGLKQKIKSVLSSHPKTYRVAALVYKKMFV
jgi:glycosyltransferase involved in cell wall biosynthesis